MFSVTSFGQLCFWSFCFVAISTFWILKEDSRSALLPCLRQRLELNLTPSMRRATKKLWILWKNIPIRQIIPAIEERSALPAMRREFIIEQTNWPVLFTFLLTLTSSIDIMKEGSLEGVEEGVAEEGQVKNRLGSTPTNLFLHIVPYHKLAFAIQFFSTSAHPHLSFLGMGHLHHRPPGPDPAKDDHGPAPLRQRLLLGLEQEHLRWHRVSPWGARIWGSNWGW